MVWIRKILRAKAFKMGLLLSCFRGFGPNFLVLSLLWARECHNPIFFLRDFLGCRHAKRGSPNQVGLIRQRLITPNNLRTWSGTHFPEFGEV